jgi:hypothetical protein
MWATYQLGSNVRRKGDEDRHSVEFRFDQVYNLEENNIKETSDVAV